MSQACDHSPFPLLALLEDAGRSLEVDVRSADVNVDSGKSGFGLGLKAAMRSFTKRRRPLIIVGLLSQAELIRASGNGALLPFLEYPRVRYLQLPIDLVALEAAARAVGGVAVPDTEVERLCDSVVQTYLDEELYTNVIHRIDSNRPVAPLFKQWVEDLRDRAGSARGRDASGPEATEPADFHDILKGALKSLEELIVELSQYKFKGAASVVLTKLRIQARNLRKAEEHARRLVDFERGEQSPGAGPESMYEAATVGLEVLKIKSQVLKVLKPMCHGRRG